MHQKKAQKRAEMDVLLHILSEINIKGRDHSCALHSNQQKPVNDKKVVSVTIIVLTRIKILLSNVI